MHSHSVGVCSSQALVLISEIKQLRLSLSGLRSLVRRGGTWRCLIYGNSLSSLVSGGLPLNIGSLSLNVRSLLRMRIGGSLPLHVRRSLLRVSILRRLLTGGVLSMLLTGLHGHIRVLHRLLLQGNRISLLSISWGCANAISRRSLCDRLGRAPVGNNTIDYPISIEINRVYLAVTIHIVPNSWSG